MGIVSKVLSATGMLIVLYLVLSNAKETTSIINGLGSAYTSGVKTLQGRG
jgi:hypothetical protein